MPSPHSLIGHVSPGAFSYPMMSGPSPQQLRAQLAMKIIPLCLASALLLSCQSTGSGEATPEPRDTAKREALFSAVSNLAGRWELTGGEEPTYIEFEVTSNNSVVREIMFPGTPSEMTNMYTLEGNALVMTHYCAGGNQPHMRSGGFEGNQLKFVSIGVGDLASPETSYMLDMCLVFVDEDHIVENWRQVTAGEITEMAGFELQRVR